MLATIHINPFIFFIFFHPKKEDLWGCGIDSKSNVNTDGGRQVDTGGQKLLIVKLVIEKKEKENKK